MIPISRTRAHRLAPVAILVAAVSTVAAAAWALGTWPTIDQGVYGVVILAEGNCMPVAPLLCERRTTVSRTIWVREPVPADALFDPSIASAYPLVAQTASGWNGFYQVRLPPGDYSVFVEDGGRPSCRVSFGGIACPLSLGSGVTRCDLLISHVTH